ncbi:peptidoglycan-binding protein [Dermacoccaceae bacterium W4C1]
MKTILKTAAGTAVLAAGLTLAGTPIAGAAPAPAAGTHPTSVQTVDDARPGGGLKAFQKAKGLRATGSGDAATARALQKAPAAEVAKYFTSAEDLNPEQLAHARTVIGVGKGAANISDQGKVIALMTAMQESKFINYTVAVDHDSLGIFQQRPSTGWGTPEQITDVPTSTKSFYGVAPFGSNPGLIQIDGWETMAPGAAAQAVQVSAYPDAYAQWETFARNLLASEGPSVDPIY